MDFANHLKNEVQNARSVMISTHIHPDADGLGSQVGLCLALKNFNPHIFCVNEEPLHSRYTYFDSKHFIESVKSFKKKYGDHFKTDLLIVVDTNHLKRIGKKVQEFISPETKIIYIDHHPHKESFGEAHYVDSSSAATGQLVTEIILELGIELTPEMALPLYTAILIDTNSFRYPTVSAKTHSIVSKLLETGISPSGAYNKIYGTKSIEHTHFLGQVLAKSSATASGKIAWMHLTKELQEKFHVNAEDSNAFINHLLVLHNIKVVCMFREDEDSIKLSLRSRGRIDVSKVASALGGGGHTHAAALRLPLPKNNEDILKKIHQIISEIEELIS